VFTISYNAYNDLKIFSLSYFILLLLLQVNTLYTYLAITRGKKYLKEYITEIVKNDKVVCAWHDKVLQKGKIYEFDYNSILNKYELKNMHEPWFVVSEYNFSTFKLISLQEQRKLKLIQLR
jgi:hypothetical protein